MSLCRHFVTRTDCVSQETRHRRRAYPRCCTAVCHDAATFWRLWASTRWCFFRYVTLEKPLVTDVLSPMFSFLDAWRQARLDYHSHTGDEDGGGVQRQQQSEALFPWQICRVDKAQGGCSAP